MAAQADPVVSAQSLLAAVGAADTGNKTYAVLGRSVRGGTDSSGK